MWFTITVDDAGAKYIDKTHAEHLVWALKHIEKQKRT